MTTTTLDTTTSFADIDTRERVKEMHKALAEEIKAITSTEDWASWLRLGSAFWNYSWNNILLMHMQRRGITMVGGAKNCWTTKFERHIKAGEKAIWIFAPLLVKPSKTEIDRGLYGPTERKCIGFKAVPVFDVSQTDGKPMPEQPAPAKRLEGEAPRELFDAMVKMIEAEGFSFRIDDMPSGMEQADGVTFFDTKSVVIKRGMSQAQTTKTTAHELAHMLLHNYEEQKALTSTGFCREDAEVEAESVAFVVLGAWGVNVGSYSFGYIVGWAGREGVDRVHKTGERVMRAAQKILRNAQPPQ